MFEEYVAVSRFTMDDNSGNVVLSRARAERELKHQSQKVRYDPVRNDSREGEKQKVGGVT